MGQHLHMFGIPKKKLQASFARLMIRGIEAVVYWFIEHPLLGSLLTFSFAILSVILFQTVSS